MARTISVIQQTIIDAKNADPILGPLLTSTSLVAVWRLWAYITAVCMWALETLFDSHKAEVSAILATQKPHTLQWYVEMAKKFQLGDTLPDDTDVYNPISTDSAVLIVQYAAAVELTNLIRIKVAKLSGGVLVPLSSPQLTAFTAYMARVKDAGVRLQLTSGNADNLQLAINIYYDPLILDSTGARLDGTASTPVKDAVGSFLTTLPFNGLFIRNRLIAACEGVEGVRIATALTVQAQYGAVPYVNIPTEYVPDAGYMKLDSAYFDAHITYVAHGPI